MIAITLASILILVVFLFFTASVVFWLFEALVLARGGEATAEDLVWGLDDVQVRIPTIDAEAIVQQTVDALPEGLDDVHVVAERRIDIEGATVHVVPEEFVCEATYKGRALEWARRNVPCDREYVLHIDEDTIVRNLEGLPDVDVVQFSELPMYTGSLVAYLCEIQRVGFQYEQRAFSRFRYPLYIWGGGFAIRTSLEDAVTWNRATITEDTNFVWNAISRGEVSFQLVDSRFRNQAPPSVWVLFKQRRRWISGMWKDLQLPPLRYRLLMVPRILIWGFSPAIFVLLSIPVLVPGLGIAGGYYTLILAWVFVFLHSVTYFGASFYRLHPLERAFAVALSLPISLTNTAGAFWGVLSPEREFEVTRKVSPGRAAAVNPGLTEDTLVEDAKREADTTAPFELSTMFGWER